MAERTVLVLSSHTPSLFWFRTDMMRAFRERGWRVVAAANEAEALWAARFRENGVEYRQIAVARNGTDPLRDLGTLRSIRALLKELRPDRIFTFQAKTVIYGALAARSLGLGEVYPLIAGMGSLFLSDSVKARAVRAVLTAEYRLALRRCPAVFFQNGDDEALFRALGIITGQKTVRLNGSGVNTERFVPTPLPERPAFLCISRLIRDKGVGEYLEASRRLRRERPDARCLLVGPFDTNPSAITKEELDAYIGDGSVEYFGEQEDVRPYLAQASVYVLASYREGTPKTVLEAMACGRAVITTDAPGCRETVTDGDNGLLVPVRDAEALLGAMRRLLDEPETLRRMGERGRALAEEKFDVRRVNADICRTMGIE